MTTSNLFLIVVSAAAMISGCGANEGVLKSGRLRSDNSASSTPHPSSFDQDLKDMRDTQYPYIYVLRRMDGAPLDAEDKSFIRTQVQANRRVVSDEERAVIIGSNAAVLPDTMMAVYGRFAVDNYSQEPASVNVKP